MKELKVKLPCNCKSLDDVEIGYVESGWMWYGVYLDENGELIYEQDEFENYEFGEYWCLTCRVPLDFTTEEEVKEFLKMKYKKVGN